MRCARRARPAATREARPRHQHGHFSFLWQNASRRVIDAVIEGRIELATRAAPIEELTDVLGRAKFSSKIAEQGVSIGALALIPKP